MALTSYVDSLEQWAARCEQLAALTLPDMNAARTAATAPAGRRLTAHAVYSAATGAQIDLPRTPQGLDEQLLAAVTGGPLPAPPAQSVGPVQQQTRGDAIEIWTETELTIVHAGWLLSGWRSACEASARWLVREIQPDNATNLPWAVHVFAYLSLAESDHDARLYAETLLHNCVVGRGRPDELSALILLDSARQLRQCAAEA